MALVYLTRPRLRDADVKEKPDDDDDREEEDVWPGVDGRSSALVSEEEEEPSTAMEVSEKAD